MVVKGKVQEDTYDVPGLNIFTVAQHGTHQCQS